MNTPSKSLTILTACDPPRGVPGEKDYQRSAIRLARSVRVNGGAYSDCKIVCVHDKPLDAWARAWFDHLGVEVRHVDTPNPNHPNSMMFAAGSSPIDTEYGLYLDSDIVVLRDLSDFFTGDADVRASPTTYAHHKWARPEDSVAWSKIIAELGLRVDETRQLRTHIDQRKARFYLSAGAILFRRESGVQNLWADLARRIFVALDAGRLPSECTASHPEPGLTLAVLTLSQLKFMPLPERLHLVYALRRRAFDDTVIVHYQDNRVTEMSDALWNVEEKP